ncbi:MAG TPA: hypothetical protein DDX19_05365 [Rhodopirellula baltica]|uniref:Uncharacterized protein n=1 Tax=Rhodopirellula baltica (strain DSM 10527 / NCIMB 13988 / SH1) TaxID=243090 RepID=Q7UEE9_RHOBA|nr:hypothetical protein [Rhodopirellula baltica]CAD79087.1 hypothetical protein RB11381 [Rhodopirellula baltica SH 1]HBE62190.1 hypothetical protein [Rhodopirellula baltica]
MQDINEFIQDRVRVLGLPWSCDKTRLAATADFELGGVNPPIAVGRVLSASELNDYDIGNKAVFDYFTSLQLLKVVEFNFEAFGTKLDDLSSDHAEHPNLNAAMVHAMMIHVNAATLNFLGAMRTYLDHTETRLKRQFGKDSEQVAAFKGAASKSFDSSFAYRFVYRLRNFTQHCGMPLGHIAANASQQQTDATTKIAQLDFFLDRDHLLRDFDGWGNVVEPDLRSQPARFPLQPLIEATVAEIRAINAVVSRSEIEAAGDRVSGLLNLIDEARQFGEHPAIIKQIEVKLDEVSHIPKMDIQLERLQVDTIADIDELLNLFRPRKTAKSARERYREGWDTVFGKDE